MLELPVNKKSQIYSKLQDYHYGEMHKRLNEMPGRLINVDKEFEEVGYFLKMLWRKYEDKLVIHDTKIKGGKHEQEIEKRLKELKIYGKTKQEIETRLEELKMDEKSKQNIRKSLKEFAFGRGESQETAGIWGVYIDLVYDTYWKKWEKAYQGTFHEFFHNIDRLAGPAAGAVFFSYTQTKQLFQLFNNNDEHQLGEIVQIEANNLSSSRKNILHGIKDKWKKGYLYDIMGGTYALGKYGPGREGGTENIDEICGHSNEYWENNDMVSMPNINIITIRLSLETFANMASVAVVNPESLKVMREYLPESYKMFVEILKRMIKVLNVYTIINTR
jgi:hypothetical protein